MDKNINTYFIDEAGVWVVERDLGNCDTCGIECNIMFITDLLLNEIQPNLCSVDCWEIWTDINAGYYNPLKKIKRLPTRLRPPLWEDILMSWPEFGPRGITVEESKIAYRGSDGVLQGCITRSRSGELSVVVSPNFQRQGVGRKLGREAGRRWGVNTSSQAFTQAGFNLLRRAIPANEEVE